MPLPRPKSGARYWGVAVGEDGLLVGARAPAARQDIQQLLRRVLEDGHELTEDDMVTLFAARGADFHAVCSAAGATASLCEKSDMGDVCCGRSILSRFICLLPVLETKAEADIGFRCMPNCAQVATWRYWREQSDMPLTCR